MKLINRSALVAAAATTLAACGGHQPRPIQDGPVVAISSFHCNCDPAVVELVQDSFVSVFLNKTNARPVKGSVGDIVIAGTLTMAPQSRDDSTKIEIGINRPVVSNGYLSDISVQAYRGGGLVGTYVESNSPGLVSHRANGISDFATDVAEELAKSLIKRHEIEER